MSRKESASSRASNLRRGILDPQAPAMAACAAFAAAESESFGAQGLANCAWAMAGAGGWAQPGGCGGWGVGVGVGGGCEVCEGLIGVPCSSLLALRRLSYE